MGECKNHLYKWVSSGNAGYQVTFLKSSYIAPFDKIGPFRRDKKGNLVTSVFQIYLSVQKKSDQISRWDIEYSSGTELSNAFNFQSYKGGE